MGIFYEQIPLPKEKSFIIREFKTSKLTFPFHNHPFFELNLIMSGSGKRMVGNKITYFKNGDLSLMGADLPHQFADDELVKTKAGFHSIILQFHADLIPDELLLKDDFFKIDQLLLHAKKGITFSGDITEIVKPLMKKLLIKRGFSGFLLFLEILHCLSEDQGSGFLSDMELTENVLPKGLEKTRKVFDYIYSNYTGELSLEKAANIINLSKPAFSHFFKKRTNKTFSNFINDIRVSHAARMLRETEIPVIQICYQSGFNNLSYFNRQFKLQNGVSPLQFRKQYGIG